MLKKASFALLVGFGFIQGVLLAQPALTAHQNQMDALKQALNLNEMQVQKIQALNDRQIQRVQQMRQSINPQERHKELSALFTQDKLDEGKLKNVIDKNKAQQDLMFELRLEQLREMHRILTPEQRKKYMELQQPPTMQGPRGQGMGAGPHGPGMGAGPHGPGMMKSTPPAPTK